MDIPLRIAGELIGIICFEKTGDKEREFTGDEQTFSLSISQVLASNIEARYRRSAQKKLDEALHELALLNAELESFSYSVSHDLKAPLRAVLGYCEILKEDYLDKLDAEGERVLDNIQQGAKRMHILIDDLLKFSKFGKKEINKFAVDMAACVNKVVEELNEANTHTATFAINMLLPAEGEESLLKQVWVNLISNAIKYSAKKQHPKIQIGSYEEGKSIVYFVKDNGAGFDMQYADRLFGVFQRLHRSSDFEGSGIGLATVRRIITRHQGAVWAEAKPEEGATFYFSLPKS
jgi:light-regulated signal transduction histidine kinase (bacteriophytochrome)